MRKSGHFWKWTALVQKHFFCRPNVVYLCSPGPCVVLRAQVLGITMCSRIKTLVLRSCPAVLIQPLISSKAICASVKVLKMRKAFDWDKKHDLEALAQVLTSLASMEELHLLTGSRYSKTYARISPKVLFDRILGQLPATLRCLAVDYLDGFRLGQLVDALNRDTLPALQELYLPCMQVDSVVEAKHLGSAFMGPSGRRLKSLFLQVTKPDKQRQWWTFLTYMLGFHIEDPENKQILPSLEKLSLGKLHWKSLGRELLKGRFPKLIEVHCKGEYSDHDLDPDPFSHRMFELIRAHTFYETSSESTRLWFEVLQHRKELRPFRSRNGILFPYFNVRNPLTAFPLANQLLQGLSQPLDPKMASDIQHLMLTGVMLDSDTCEALARALESRNFLSLKQLAFVLDPSSGLESFTNLGKVLNQDNLPCLDYLSLAARGTVAHPWMYFLNCWQLFFKAMAVGRISKLTTLDVGCLDGSAECTTAIFAAIGTLPSPSVLFSHVSSVKTCGLREEDILGISQAVSSGAFPSLEYFNFFGKTFFSCRSLLLHLLLHLVYFYI